MRVVPTTSFASPSPPADFSALADSRAAQRFPKVCKSSEVRRRENDRQWHDDTDAASMDVIVDNHPAMAPSAPNASGGGKECAGTSRKKGKEKKKGHGRSKSAPIWTLNGRAALPALELQTDGPHKWQLMGADGKRSTGKIAQSASSTKCNITIPKKRYSVWRRDSLIDMDTPEFTETDRRLRKSVPSSPRTVLVLSGLFVCGLMLVLSGTIVLAKPPHDPLFKLVGAALLLLGLSSLLICALVQRKNVGKWMTDMTRDLFALRESNGAGREINDEEEQGKRAAGKDGDAGGANGIFAQMPDTLIRQQ